MAFRRLASKGSLPGLLGTKGFPLSGVLSRCTASAASTAKPAVETIEVTVDGKPITIPKGYSVLQACDLAGLDIPRFCYHQKLSIAGNCRMCLVEVEKIPKPVASCAMPAGPGMNIKTDSPLVRKAREGVMEFLLMNHPLDCAICDQGGECDLQDQSMSFGSDRGRFTEMKRSVGDKNLGPLVKTVMTRCIHCTRCVRFASEVAGVEDLGVTGRGRDSEIGTYVEKLMSSELSGNVIDLCPVGALTSKPFAFTARAWELRNTESIDVSDALGANIRIDSRGTEVMRVAPRLNEEVNEEWLSDKARFQYDGLKRQRLSVPMMKGPDGLKNTTWAEALGRIQEKISGIPGSQMKAIVGNLADAESMIVLKDLMNKLGCNNLVHEGGFEDLTPDIRSSYIANSRIAGVDEADMILLIGTNPRKESPVFNARIRKAVLNGARVGVIGEKVDLTYLYDHLGDNPEALDACKSGPVMDALKGSSKPMIIVGAGVLRRKDRDAVLTSINEIVSTSGAVKEGWNGYNVMHDVASRVAAMDLGIVPSHTENKTPAKFVYLLGSDDYNPKDIPADAFVVYQGHHGEAGASRADVILPGAAYTEKSGTYVNFEGRVQRTRTANPPHGAARDDWKIIRALSEVLGVQLPYDSVDAVRGRMGEVAPHLLKLNSIEPSIWMNGHFVKANLTAAVKDPKTPLASSIADYYMTDVISRTSRTMAKCVQARQTMRH
ncbi:hypothetical protein BSKO_13073 [Bryopsis sp. KO-2023]|nr:hypothetical protein BSKO_13073 [Bryopsis sp. KO-2023]